MKFCKNKFIFLFYVFVKDVLICFLCGYFFFENRKKNCRNCFIRWVYFLLVGEKIEDCWEMLVKVNRVIFFSRD